MVPESHRSVAGRSARPWFAIAAIAVACGADVAAEDSRCEAPEASADSATDNDSGDPDATSSKCEHRQACSTDGSFCTNGCGQDCRCGEVSGKLIFQCNRPVENSFCDPTAHFACSYPIEDRPTPAACECGGASLPPNRWHCEGDDYWPTECPRPLPHDGSSCDFAPLGLRCYSSSTEPQSHCDCVEAGAWKTWVCTD